MRVLGIDFGERRIGLALGDTEARIASPWDVIQTFSDRESITKIQEIITKEQVEALVLGWPRSLRNPTMNTPQTKRVGAFQRALESLHLPIHREDETLSSRAAAVLSKDAGLKGKRDDLAAVTILQSWLDRNAVSS